jgi:hypothetical protein
MFLPFLFFAKIPIIFFASIVIIFAIKIINKSLEVDQMANINIKNTPYSQTGSTISKLTYPVFQKSNPIANFVSFKFFGPSNFPTYFILKNNPEIITRLENILSGYCGLKNMTGKTIDSATLPPPAAGSQSSFSPPSPASKDDSSDNPARKVSNGIGRAISAFIIFMVVGNTVYGMLMNYKNITSIMPVTSRVPAKTTSAAAPIDYTYYSSKITAPMLKITPLEAKENLTVIDDYTKSKVLVEFALPKDYSMLNSIVYNISTGMNIRQKNGGNVGKDLDLIKLQYSELTNNPRVSEIKSHPDGTYSFVYDLPFFADQIKAASPESVGFGFRFYSQTSQSGGGSNGQILKIKK